MKSSILGLGEYHPEQSVGNDAWPAEFALRARATGDRTLIDIPQALDEAGTISAEYLAREQSDPFLGATRRRIAPAEVTSFEAEIIAARAALADAELDGSQIDFVLSYAITPERVSPSNASPVAHAIGAHAAVALGVDTACATALTQIQLAEGLIASGQARHVLLTQSHLLNRAFARMHPASPGLGDCATAFVMGARPRYRVLGVCSRTHGEFFDAVTWTRGKRVAHDQWWKTGEDFYIGSCRPEGAKYLMQETVAYGARTVREVLAQVGLDHERIGTFVSVQPRGWIPFAIARCLGFPAEATVCSYDEYAHLGGCGPVVNLIRARAQGRFAEGGLVAVYAQGAGFTRAAAVIDMGSGRESALRSAAGVE
jgi:3-oxoacyl-[acyl-carrier-protein] synthase-3